MPIINIGYVLPHLMLAAALPCRLAAQAPTATPPKPDSPQVLAHIEMAKTAGGTMWAQAANFFCVASRANSPNDPVIEPAKIFDNVYAIGREGTVVYAITTSAGILLIDSGYQNEVETILLAGLRRLGLDPAQVKMIVMGHGHADHFGGAPYFQEHYGTKVYVSQADWEFMENPPAARGGAKKAPPGPPVTLPNHDMVITEGQPIVLGDVRIMPFAIPGHTPGSMGLIFPVKDNGQTHLAAMYGGTILGVGAISDEGLQQYLRSIAHFKEETAKARVDVELQNHPLYDGLTDKLAKLKRRRAEEPNPFVVGQDGYQKFMDVMSHCMQAQIERRK